MCVCVCVCVCVLCVCVCVCVCVFVCIQACVQSVILDLLTIILTHTHTRAHTHTHLNTALTNGQKINEGTLRQAIATLEVKVCMRMYVYVYIVQYILLPVHVLKCMQCTFHKFYTCTYVRMCVCVLGQKDLVATKNCYGYTPLTLIAYTTYMHMLTNSSPEGFYYCTDVYM